MIIPSLSNYAPKADAGSAFVGGAGVGQRAVEARLNHQAAMAGVAQRASEASMQGNIAMQKLAAEQAQAEMMNQARQAALQQEMLQKQQELEVQKAYQQSMVGLKQQEIANEKAVNDAKVQQAALQFQAQQKMVQEAQNAFATGQVGSPEEGFSQAALKYGMEAGFSGGEMARFAGPSGGGGLGPARLLPVEGTDKYDYFQTSEGGRTLVPRKAEVPKGVEDIAGTGYQRVDGKVVPKREDAGTKTLREDIKRLKESMSGKETMPHRMALGMVADPKYKPTATDKFYIAAYKQMQDKLAEMEKQLAQTGGSSAGGGTNRVRKYNLQTRKFE